MDRKKDAGAARGKAARRRFGIATPRPFIKELHPLLNPSRFRPISAAGMRALDQKAAKKYKIPTLLLMENAGRSLALAVQNVLKGRRKSITIFCGGGNNGGDGLVAARYLFNLGYGVRIVLARPPARFQGDALTQWNAAKVLKIPFQIFHSRKKLLESMNYGPGAVVDALLGTGFQGPVRDDMLPLIQTINGFHVPVIAADVPSGLDADSGSAQGAAVKAKMTVTFGLPKTGMLRLAARPYIGRLWVADIGFPRPLIRPYIKRI